MSLSRIVGSLAAGLGIAAGCGTAPSPGFDPADPAGTTDRDGGATGRDGSSGNFGSIGSGDPEGGAAPSAVCPGCTFAKCPSGVHTTVSGTTYAPNGTLPLYNVQVYVPSGSLAPFPKGVSCDRCGPLNSTSVVASALSDAHGNFKLQDPPVGTNVPLVLQVGKWRREVHVPQINPCVDNPITSADLTRLPRTRAEGDMPRIAVTTGFCDNLSCLLPKVGVDASELGIDGEDKAVIHFHGSGASNIPSGFSGLDPSSWGPSGMTAASTLWGDLSKLNTFDMAIFSCECNEPGAEMPASGYDNITQYLDRGGRVFGTDYQYVWYNGSTDAKLASAMTIRTGEQDVNQGPVDLVTTFPKGKALADWMQFVDPNVTYGQLQPTAIFDHLMATTPAVQVWATSLDSADANHHARIVTTNTPVGAPADQQCGKGAHLDLHVTPLPKGGFTFDFPQQCGSLAQGEEALAFLLFDLAACIQDDTQPPQPPPPVVH